MTSSTTPWDIYANALSGHGYGYPLWAPEPHSDETVGEVHLGDVGYIREGRFYFLFSTTDETRNARGQPVVFEAFTYSDLDVYKSDNAIEPTVIKTGCDSINGNVDGGSAGAARDEARFRTSASTGGLLVLSEPASQEKLQCELKIRRYMRQHVDRWLTFANDTLGIGLANEDLIFVSGFVKSSRWATVAFQVSNPANVVGELILRGVDVKEPEVSTSQSNEAARPAVRVQDMLWHVTMSSPTATVYSRIGPPNRTPSASAKKDQCLFLNYFKMRRRIWRPVPLRAASGPHVLPPPEDDGRFSAPKIPSGACDPLDLCNEEDIQVDPPVLLSSKDNRVETSSRVEPNESVYITHSDHSASLDADKNPSVSFHTSVSYARLYAHAASTGIVINSDVAAIGVSYALAVRHQRTHRELVGLGEAPYEVRTPGVLRAVPPIISTSAPFARRTNSCASMRVAEACAFCSQNIFACTTRASSRDPIELSRGLVDSAKGSLPVAKVVF